MRDHFPYAFVTFLIKNDSYLPGALLLAYALRKQRTIADIVCIVTEGTSQEAAELLRCLYTRVVRVTSIRVPDIVDQRRQYLSEVFSRLHALRLGPEGDLGCQYRKVVVLDADILPLRAYQQLFLLDAPAAILNERKEFFVANEGCRDAIFGSWKWHEQYRSIPHGCLIPRSITDRVSRDSRNYGMNTALLVVEPSLTSYFDLVKDLQNKSVVSFIKSHFRWPDMQYLTFKWSGAWHNVDLAYASVYGLPQLEVVNGIHYVGPKPWQLQLDFVSKRARFRPAYKFWYGQFLEMMDSSEPLRRDHRLARIAAAIMDGSRAEHALKKRCPTGRTRAIGAT